MTTKLFISYRSNDSAKVDAIVSKLRTLKNTDGTPCYQLWQDKINIPDGHDWWSAIVDAIIDCDIFIFMMSKESVVSIPCRAELSYAYQRNRPIIPLVLEGEFFYNPKTAKNDISYWSDVPQVLDELRTQFLFYEGGGLIDRLEKAIAGFKNQSRIWTDIPAPRPPDPREVSEDTNNVITIYGDACDYAMRPDFASAERLFRKVVRLGDADFADDARDWIELLGRYQKLVQLDSNQYTRYQMRANWEEYKQLFPKRFIDFYDPKDFKTRLDVSTVPITLKKPSVANLMPKPFMWVNIPAGPVTLKGTPGGYIREHILLTFNVASFIIAKYPITNAQFQRFIQAKGYENRKWWTDAGWEMRQKEKWSEPRYWQYDKFNTANKPVVGLSWYEAIAFCLWLQDITDEPVMLPTEQQWQRAAQALPDGRDSGYTYPWGNEWDAHRCNNNGDQTSLVTQFEGKGDSPCGVVDLSGNVWEWCVTDYKTGDRDINKSVISPVLRGGSWDLSDIGYLQAAVRNPYVPEGWGNYMGFRCVRSI